MGNGICHTLPDGFMEDIRSITGIKRKLIRTNNMLDSIEYAARGGYECPVCIEETGTSVLKTEKEVSYITELLQCEKCSATWKAHYLLTGYQELTQMEPETVKTKVMYEGIDVWNRAVFRELREHKGSVKPRNRYGSLNDLFPYEEPEAEVLKKVKAEDLVFLGTSFGCEPEGTSCDVAIIKEADVPKDLM